MNVDEYNQCFNKDFPALKRAERIETIIKRPEIKLKDILCHLAINYNDDIIQEVEFSTKYAGYIKRNQQLMDRFSRYEDYTIPTSFNYNSMESLSSEAKEKLTKIQPSSFGQAARISGISPADLAVLLVFLERVKRTDRVSRET
jgi:tRNA uridine 5-carboxymethylaminomethyl modification enzyme